MLFQGCGISLATHLFGNLSIQQPAVPSPTLALVPSNDAYPMGLIGLIGRVRQKT